MCSLFPEGSSPKDYEVIAKFKQISEENPRDLRALTYYGVVQPTEILAVACYLGHPLAQAWYSVFSDNPDDKLAYAEKSAKQGEPHGFFQLADYLRHRVAVNRALMIDTYRQGAELGNTKCMVHYGEMAFNVGEAEGYFWVGMAALHGSYGLNYFYGRVVSFFEGVELQHWDEIIRTKGNRIVYVISYIINEHHHMNFYDTTATQRECSGNIENAYKVLWFYPAICQRARLAVDTWTLVGRRLGVSRDIRRMIGEMVWDLRHDADYAPGFDFVKRIDNK